MKFDYCIGNPPYQGENDSNGRKPPVYHFFMEEAYKIASCVELITPSRFLFNAGQTPQSWNEKMLNDEHFKVLSYEAKAELIFPKKEIKGGVAVTLRDEGKNFGKIGVFTPFEPLKSIMQKVEPFVTENISSIFLRGVPYSYTPKFKDDHPEWASLAGNSFDLRTNTLDNLENKIYFLEKPHSSEYVQIFGLLKKKRNYMWVRREYINTPNNFEKYKVFISKASGSGEYGETLAALVIGRPHIGHTQSFLSVGDFDSEREAEHLTKYIKSKFARSLLGIYKTTQDITPDKWKYVPLQDFTSGSDIDWSVSVAEIDRQLYKKYGLDADEITFIEENVKEMK